MKKIVMLALALFCLGFFSACGGEDTSAKNFDTVAEEFTEAMFAGEYDKAAAMVHDDFAADFNAEAVKSCADGMEAAYGEYEGISGITESSMADFLEATGMDEQVSADDLDFKVYFEGVSFADGELGIYFMFDPTERSVCGITVCGDEERPDIAEED